MAVGSGSARGLLEVIVAAPGPSPNAGTEPTCLVRIVVSCFMFGLLIGVGFGSWGGLLEITVAAPAPFPKAGTEPTCFVCEATWMVTG